jgi:hypothetical protein
VRVTARDKPGLHGSLLEISTIQANVVLLAKQGPSRHSRKHARILERAGQEGAEWRLQQRLSARPEYPDDLAERTRVAIYMLKDVIGDHYIEAAVWKGHVADVDTRDFRSVRKQVGLRVVRRRTLTNEATQGRLRGEVKNSGALERQRGLQLVQIQKQVALAIVATAIGARVPLHVATDHLKHAHQRRPGLLAAPILAESGDPLAARYAVAARISAAQSEPMQPRG